jgi:regulator of sigma E protease
MNLLFAWLLISITLMFGTPRGLTDSEIANAKSPELAVTGVLAGSPAEAAGFKVGDLITGASADGTTFAGADAEGFTTFVAKSAGKPVALTVERNGTELTLTAIPKIGAVPNAPGRAALGVGVAPFGIVPLPWYEAFIRGAEVTADATEQIGLGLIHFFGSLFTFTADLSQVSGPVGIAGAVGGAAASGPSALLTLTAIISINLALINLLPVPALDGGRLLFVLIEAVTRKRLPSNAAATANTIGFALLILLMLVVTAHDLWKIFA